MNGQVEIQKLVVCRLTMSNIPNKQLIDLDVRHSEHCALSTDPANWAGISPNRHHKTVVLEDVNRCF